MIFKILVFILIVIAQYLIFHLGAKLYIKIKYRNDSFTTTIKSITLKNGVAIFHFGFLSNRKIVPYNQFAIGATKYIDSQTMSAWFYQKIGDQKLDINDIEGMAKDAVERAIGWYKDFNESQFNYMANELGIEASLKLSNKSHEQLLEDSCHDFDFYPRDDKELTESEFKALLNDLKSLGFLTLLSETQYFNQEEDERSKDYLFTINNDELTAHVSVCADSVEIESTSEKLPTLLIETIEKHNFILDEDE